MKRIFQIIALLIAFSGGICGIVAICIQAPRQVSDFDYLGMLVGILSLLVLFTVGWQIYTIIDTKSAMKEIEAEIRDTLEKQNETIRKISDSQNNLRKDLEDRVNDVLTVIFAQMGLALRFYVEKRGSIQFYLNSIARYDGKSKDNNAHKAFEISIQHLKEIRNEFEEEKLRTGKDYKILFPPEEVALFKKIILKTQDPVLIKWILNKMDSPTS